MRIDLIGRWLMHLAFPPVCRGCGERFDIFKTPDPLPLCPDCLARWENFVQRRAQQGAQGMPQALAESGCRAMFSRVTYHPGQKQLAERLLLRAKDHRDRPLFRFFAEDMRLPLWQLLEQYGDATKACIVFVPRRPEAKQRAGHDQGEQLALALGDALELPVVCALQHRRGTSAQKQLTAAARAENAKSSYLPTKHAAKLRGKTVILVDDIVTAGTTLAAATSLLLEQGAAVVVAATVASASPDIPS